MPPLKNLNISFIFTCRKPLPLPCIKDSACSQGHTRGVTHTQTLFYQLLIYSLGAQWAEADTSKDLGTSPLQPPLKITAMSPTITAHAHLLRTQTQLLHLENKLGKPIKSPVQHPGRAAAAASPSSVGRFACQLLPMGKNYKFYALLTAPCLWLMGLS